MSQNKFNELHLFVDETGLLANIDAYNPKTRGKDLCLVGGVVFWGEYDKFDARLAKILKETVATHYGIDSWSELHYYDSEGAQKLGAEYWPKKNAFLAALRDELQRDACADRFQGVSIRHESDLGAPSSLLSENEEDNRYLFMLQSLIEQVVFSDETARRLTKDAKIVVRIASRQLVLPRGDARIPLIKARLDRLARRLYLKPSERRLYYEKVDRFEVPYFHNEKDIRNATTAFLKYRRPDATYDFNDQRVETINYNRFDNQGRYKELSASGYYLADIFLGQKRNALSARAPKSGDAASFVVPEFKSWTYEPASEELARCDADLANGGGYFDDLLWSQPDLVANPLFAEFKNKLAQTLSAKNLRRYWDRLRFDIDASRSEAFNQARATFVNVDEITRLRSEERRREDAQKFPKDDAENQLSRAWVRFAIANHSGDVAEGERVWQDIANLEPLYRRLSPEKELEFRTETGLRRAVNLLDAFRFDEARRIVAELIERQEETLRFVQSSKFFEDRTKRFQLGRCYSQLGQIEACSGSFESARKLFEQAAAQYDATTDAADLERNAIYLGHVACDMCRFAVGDCGKSLWAQTLANVPTLKRDSQINDNLLSLKNLNDDNRYWAPLLLKGVWLFENDDQVADLLDDWDASPLKRSIYQRLNEKRSEWPDGAVLQSVAESRARLYRKLRTTPFFESTRNAFNDAISALQKEDSPLMNFLAAVARLRKALWLVDADRPDASRELQAAVESAITSRASLSPSSKSNVQTTSNAVESNVSLQNRARQIVDAVRFNYY